VKDLAEATVLIVFMLLVASTCDGRNGVDMMDAAIDYANGECNAK